MALLIGSTAIAAAERLNTLNDISRALNACWMGPPAEHSVEGMEITVRFSLTRDGNILGEPRFTFVTAGIAQPIRAVYQRAVAEALLRCMPLSVTPELGHAIAGRPFSWRIVETRKQRKA